MRKNQQQALRVSTFDVYFGMYTGFELQKPVFYGSFKWSHVWHY